MIKNDKPSITRKDMDAVLSCMVSEEIGPGAQGEQLIRELSVLCGGKRGLALAEYPRAIEIALRALGLERETPVVISPLAPAAILEAVMRSDLKPAFCDVRLDDGCLDPEKARHLAESEGAGALILSANFGIVPDAEAFADFPVPIIDDFSQGFPGEGAEDGYCGAGAYALFRFDPSAPLTCGGGAAVIAAKNTGWKRLKESLEMVDPRCIEMPDMNAALGLTQLKEMKEYRKRRLEIDDLFRKAVMKTKHRNFLMPEREAVFPLSFPLVVNSNAKEIIQYARKKGVEVRRAYEGAVVAEFESEEHPCPQAEQLALRTVLFPLYPLLAKGEVETVAKILATLP